MAGLFADENFPLPAVEELRRLGLDVETTLEAGLVPPVRSVVQFFNRGSHGLHG